MKIAIIIEGKTEKAFMSCLRTYLKDHVNTILKLAGG